MVEREKVFHFVLKTIKNVYSYLEPDTKVVLCLSSIKETGQSEDCKRLVWTIMSSRNTVKLKILLQDK